MYLDAENAEFAADLDEERKIYAWKPSDDPKIISADANADGFVSIADYSDVDEFFEKTGMEERIRLSGAEFIHTLEGAFSTRAHELLDEEES